MASDEDDNFQPKKTAKVFYIARYYFRHHAPRVYKYVGDCKSWNDRAEYYDADKIQSAVKFDSMSRAKAASKSPRLRCNRKPNHEIRPNPLVPIWEFLKVEETTAVTYSMQIAHSTATPLEQLANEAAE